MPLVIFTGVDVNVPPLQIAAVILFMPGVGFTVMVRVKSVPLQLPRIGVTI
jgi:hypothetical protein